MEADIALLVLRVAIGAVFAAHGLQKLFGWWQGPGWTGWQGFVTFLGFRPVAFWAAIAVVAEVGGGLALVAGLLVPVAAAGLVAQSLVLGWKVHWPKGFWVSNGGVEFPLVLLAGASAVQLLGPGAWSIDGAAPAFDVLYEPAVRWVFLAIAVLGALVAIGVSAVQPAPAPGGGAEGAASDEGGSGE